MKSSIEIKGLEVAVKRLQRASQMFAPPKVRPILLKGAKTLRDAAQANAPVDTGALKSAIVAKLAVGQGTLVAYMEVDMSMITKVNRKTHNRVRYPYFVEFGHGVVRAVQYFRRAVNGKRAQVSTQIKRDLAALAREESSNA